MRRSWWFLMAAAALAVAMASCGGRDSMGTSGAGTGGEGSGPACGAGQEADHAERFCHAVRDPFCEALFACCDDPNVHDLWGGSVEGCKQFWGSCEPGWDPGGGLRELLESGKTVLDEAKLDACSCKLSAMSAGGAACTEPVRSVLTTDCYSAFEGQVPPGGACGIARTDISFMECKGGECHDFACQAYVESGAECVPSDTVELCNYPDGEWCHGAGVTATCQPRAEDGDPCATPGEITMRCRSGLCGADGACAPATGEALCGG